MVLRIATITLLLALAGALVPGGASASEPTGSAAASCAGARIDLSLSSPSLPGGAWSVDDGCLPAGAHFEVELAGYRLVLALGEVEYDQGHRGRLVLAALSLPGGGAASLVGVEDAVTGLVRWAYAEGTQSAAAGATTWRGDGLTDADDASAHLEVSVRGRGADLMTAPGPVAEVVRSLVLDAVARLA